MARALWPIAIRMMDWTPGDEIGEKRRRRHARGLCMAIGVGEVDQQPEGSFTEEDKHIAMKFNRAGFGLP